MERSDCLSPAKIRANSCFRPPSHPSSLKARLPRQACRAGGGSSTRRVRIRLQPAGSAATASYTDEREGWLIASAPIVGCRSQLSEEYSRVARRVNFLVWGGLASPDLRTEGTLLSLGDPPLHPTRSFRGLDAGFTTVGSSESSPMNGEPTAPVSVSPSGRVRTPRLQAKRRSV